MTSYRVADDVAWVSSEELDVGEEPTAYVVALPRGPAIVLDGSACVVWLAVAEGGTRGEVIDRALALGGIALAGVDRAAVESDTRELLDGLVRAGVVTLD